MASFSTPSKPHTLKEIAAKLGAQLRSEAPDTLIHAVATLENARSGTITFLSNAKYTNQLAGTQASACIIAENAIHSAPNGLSLVVHPNPHEAFAMVLDLLYPNAPRTGFISPKASVAATAVIGANVVIEDFAVVGEGAVVGDDVLIGASSVIGPKVHIGSGTEIASNCTIANSTLGRNCIIHPGARIGQDGFGFAKTKTGLKKVKQLGSVVIGSDVEIGANTCIDRGAIEDTVVMDGTKIDNLVQIGHNSVVGRSCVICGQVGLAGTSKIGNGVMLGGQVGVAGHLTVGDSSMVAAQSGVMEDVASSSMIGGSPAMPIRDWHRSTVIIKKLIKQGKNGTEAK